MPPETLLKGKTMSEENELKRPVSEPEPESVSEPEPELQDPEEHWMLKKGINRSK